MIDYHSHLLPQMDDGAKSVEESIRLLKEERSQGIEMVCLTSHYYHEKMSIQDFLDARKASFEELKKEDLSSCPKLLLGAEVAYYEGISKEEELSKLFLEGTNILLLEMPFCRWDEKVFNELYQLSARGDVSVLLAHIERYLPLQKKGTLKDLISHGIYLQSNAEVFAFFLSCPFAVKLIRKNALHVLGTDTHNAWLRRPDMKMAINAIERSLGKEKAVAFIMAQDAFFKDHKS